MALVVGRANGVLDMVLEAARSAQPAPKPPDILDALVKLTTEGYQKAVPVLRAVVADDESVSARPALASVVAAGLWDVDAHTAVTDRIMKTGRASGSQMMLRLGLAQTASGAVFTGDFGRAMSAIAEEEAIADAAGAPPLMYPRLHLAGMRGRPKEAAEIIEAASEFATTAGIGQLVANIHWATAVLRNGLGDYPAVLTAARQAVAGRDLFIAAVSPAELIEVAVRCGEHAAAEEALASPTEHTQASL